jgi:hypothetical protein
MAETQALPVDAEIGDDEPVNLGEELSLLVGYFEESENNTRTARERSERCRAYYNNQQLSSAEIAALKRRGQAPIYVNYIQRKVDTLCGIERRTRTDPKAFPRTPQDDEAATAATDALRYIADQNRFNAIRSEAFNDILVEGTGAAEVIVTQRPSGDIDVQVKRIPWDRFWFDPHSRNLDFSDALYKGLVIWDDVKNVKRKYGLVGEKVMDDTIRMLGQASSDTYDDRPRDIWADNQRKRVRIVQCYYQKDGEWWVATYTKGGFLVEPQPSPYVDKFGIPDCPIIARSGYVNAENERYGHVEGLIPLQDEINKRRSKSLHLLSVRQTYGNKTAIKDVDKAKSELAKPDGHVELNAGAAFGQDFGVLPTGDMAQGQFLMLQQALGEMNATGANAALAGKDERAQSGRALQQRAQMGATELEPQTDGLREWTHQIYEAMWMRVRQYWTDQKWIRVTDDNRNIKWVGLNKQVTFGEKLEQGDPNAQMLAQQLGIQPGDPRLQELWEVENDVSGLDVDIIVDEGPDVATIQGEQFEVLTNLYQIPAVQAAIPVEAIIEASSLRNKDAILDGIKNAKAQAGQQQQEAAAKAQQIAEAEAQSKVQKTVAETEKIGAQTQQIAVQTHIDGMQALQPVYTPGVMQ